MFFDAGVYTSFVTACREAGITVPIIPGIMCINTVAGFQRMVAFCHTRVPEALWESVRALPKDDEEAVRRFGIKFGAEICQELLRAGVPGLHFYTLNLAKVTLGILAALGMGPVPATLGSSPTASAKVDEGALKAGSSKVGHEHAEEEEEAEERVLVA